MGLNKAKYPSQPLLTAAFVPDHVVVALRYLPFGSLSGILPINSSTKKENKDLEIYKSDENIYKKSENWCACKTEWKRN